MTGGNPARCCTAYDTMENKVGYLKQWIGEVDAMAYRNLHIRNNLCGFLSIGRLDIARQWYELVVKHDVKLDTSGSKLAAVSVCSGVNLYAMGRWLHKAHRRWILRPDARRYDRLLARWQP